MMLHQPQPQSPAPATHSTANTTTSTLSSLQTVIPSQPDQPARAGTKRKAESQDNVRLSKRLSLLNLEQNGSKLYVPVETPSLSPRYSLDQPSANPPTTPAPSAQAQPTTGDDSMHLDDTKHKVYIYNIDDELSSEDEGNDADDGRLVFLPDIEKHLRANRIPQQVLANSEGELAGMQLVLYRDPKSFYVPNENHAAKQAFLDARQKQREKEQSKSNDVTTEQTNDSAVNGGSISTQSTNQFDESGDVDVDMDMDID